MPNGRNQCTCNFCIAEQHERAIAEHEAREREGEDYTPEPYANCASCDGVVEEEDAHSLGDEVYCESCYGELAVVCGTCEATMHRDDDYVYWCDYDDRYVCEGCYCDYYFRCHACEEIFPEHAGTSTSSGSYCESCAMEYLTSCDACNRMEDLEDMYTREREAEERRESGAWDEEDLEYWEEDEHEYLCYDCARGADWVTAGARAEAASIRDYYYKPTIQVRMTEKGKLLNTYHSSAAMLRTHIFGLELEVENREGRVVKATAAKRVVEISGGLLYCKHDSSIREGFEIVSHPGVEEYWLKGEGHTIFDAVLMYLRESGYQSHRGGRCGFHIHTNKEPLSPMHRFNLVRFLHDPRMRMFLFGMSRRSEGQMSSYSMMTLPEETDGEEATLKRYAMKIAKGGSNPGRSTILNLQGPTAELRLFRGTLDRTTFWGDFQFYHSVLKYTDPKAGNLRLDERPTWASYRQYVESNPLPHEVAELRTHLKELGI